jgi:hypothetical protein
MEGTAALRAAPCPSGLAQSTAVNDPSRAAPTFCGKLPLFELQVPGPPSRLSKWIQLRSTDGGTSLVCQSPAAAGETRMLTAFGVLALSDE